MAQVIGALYLTAGICGYISNPWIGDAGIIRTNGAHDIVNAAFGLVLIGCSFGGEIVSSMALYFVALLSAVFAVFGFLCLNPAGIGRIAETILVNSAANWFHAALALICVVAGMSNTASQQVIHE